MKSVIIKITAAALAIVMMCSFAGCKAKKQGTGATGNIGEVTSLTLEEVMNSIPDDLKGSTIKYMVWYDVDAETEGPVISAFKNQYGINVDVEQASYDDFRTELAGRIASDKSPDLVRLLKPSAAELKMLQPLSVTAFNFADTAWDKQTMADYTIGNNVYATNLVNTVYFDAQVIFYNKQILADYGMDDPYTLWQNGQWTWDKYWSMCQEFKKGGGSYGAGMIPRILCQVEGVDYFDFVDGRYVNSITDPTRNQILVSKLTETLQRIKEKSMSQHENQFAAFDSGKSAFFCSAITRGLTKRTSYHAKYKEFKELRCVPLPTSETSKNYVVMNEYSAWGIPQGAKNPKAVPYFLRYMLDMDNYDINNLYSDPSMVEVHMHLIKGENRYASHIKQQLSKVDNGTSEYIIFNKLVASGPENVSSVLNSYSNNIQDAVDKGNLQIDMIKEGKK